MKEQIARHLLNIGAVELQPSKPFTWSSGMKSPIYCDNRVTISYPEVRREIASGFEKIIREHYPEAEVIAGAATGGVPHAAWVSERMKLPMVYVRGSAKGHGKQKQVEGVVKEGQKAVVIEDLVSTGGSVIKVVNALRSAGVEVLGAVAIFTYGLKKAEEAFREAGLDYKTITDFPALLAYASKTDGLNIQELEKLKKWHHNPDSEAWLT